MDRFLRSSEASAAERVVSPLYHTDIKPETEPAFLGKLDLLTVG